MDAVIRSAAAAGWHETGGRREILASAVVPGSAAFAEQALRVEAFPGRWNPRRRIPPAFEPLPAAAATALERAGWWRPGSGEACRGGLVIACDGGPLLAALAFGREVRAAGAAARPAAAPSSSPPGAGAKVGPAAFLEALPSTAAGVLGILFGLSEYQATVVGGALAGLEALRHALDLLAGGRLERVLVAALGVREGEFRSAPGGASVRLAAALALESANVAAPPGLYIRIACGVTPGEDGLEPPYGRQGALLELSAPGREVGAAPLFLAAIAARRMEEDPTAPPCVLINQVDPATGERGWAFITNEREERSVGCPPRRP